MQHRPLIEIDPQALTYLVGVCLSDEDSASLLEVDDPPTCCAFAVGVSRHNRIHARCRKDEEFAQRVTDLLDLRHADTVWAVRTSEAEDVRRAVVATVRERRFASYPGLIWASLTDGRPLVQAAGGMLVFECFRAGCESIRSAERAAAR